MESKKARVNLHEEEVKEHKDLYDQDLIAWHEFKNARRVIDEKYAKIERNIRQERIAGFFQVAQALGRAAMVGAEAGKAGEKTRKRIAVASAVIDAFAGAQKAWKANAENPVLAGAMYGITLATGLAQAKIINDQKI